MTSLSDRQPRYVFSGTSDVDRLVRQQSLFVGGFREVAERILDDFGLAAQIRGGGRVLDVGCAHGRYMGELRAVLAERGRDEGVRIDGIDIDDDALAYARRAL